MNRPQALRVAWLDELAEAARVNLDEAPARLLAEAHAAFLSLPYRFLGESHEILSLAGARARGYGACADAAAALAAAAYAFRWSKDRALLCVEAPRHLEGYSHVRVIVDGIAYDPYDGYRADVPSSCEWTVKVRDLVERPRVTIRRTSRVGT